MDPKTEDATKASKRHSTADMAHVQSIHDAYKALGAVCGDATKAGARHSAADLADFQEGHDRAVRHGAACEGAEVKAEELPADIDGIVSTGDLLTMAGSSVKALGDRDGWVGGYLVRFGGEGDLTPLRDVFTPQTDYGTARKSAVWVHHRQLPGVGKRRLTNEAELSIDDEGVFFKHLLDLRNAYEAKLYDMVDQNKLGLSSGTAPHLVERKALSDGRHEVLLWPLGLDASYTPTPAGGFGVTAAAMKSIFDDAGVDLLNVIYEAKEAQAAITNEDERARRLKIKLDLLALELEC